MVEHHRFGRAGWLVGFGAGVALGIVAMDSTSWRLPTMAVLGLLAIASIEIGRRRYKRARNDAE